LDGLVTELPDKQFFKIGEVARITGVKPHVLRYWETEFSSIRPQKTKTNQRLYRRRDVQLLLLVKQLLYQEGFTIAGANRRLRELRGEKEPEPPPEPASTAAASQDRLLQITERLRHEFRELLAMVEDDE
jgi:DNA-binding transcriptional MerR regulator